MLVFDASFDVLSKVLQLKTAGRSFADDLNDPDSDYSPLDNVKPLTLFRFLEV